MLIATSIAWGCAAALVSDPNRWCSSNVRLLSLTTPQYGTSVSGFVHETPL
jgi:hypothetical protein